jgi:hypothetical protein
MLKLFLSTVDWSSIGARSCRENLITVIDNPLDFAGSFIVNAYS